MNILETYIRDISRYQLITQEQELILALLARQGDTEARDQLIHAHLRMVVNIARHYLRPGVEMLDLIQEGNIGLMEAVDKFDPNMGNRLSTLAFYWINKHIQRFLDNEPDDLISLDMEITTSREYLLLSDTIADQGTILGDQTIQHIDTVMESEERQQLVHNLLSTLSRHEQKVLRLLYGLNLRRSYTVSEVAKILRISKVRVCQLRDRALEKMHAPGAIQRR